MEPRSFGRKIRVVEGRKPEERQWLGAMSAVVFAGNGARLGLHSIVADEMGA